MAKLFITKGKLLKDSVEVSFIKHNDDDVISTGSESFTAPVHPSLRAAFDKLAVHAALIAEFVSEDVFKDIGAPDKETISQFVVTGFTIKGGEEMKGVIISARRLITHNKQVGFNTPLLYFKDESDDAYLYTTELFSAVKLCQTELVLYMGGKHGTAQQQKMDLKTPKDEEQNDNADVAEKPKRAAKKAAKKSAKKAKKSPNKKDAPADTRTMDDVLSDE